jgi:hypothetical protein
MTNVRLFKSQPTFVGESAWKTEKDNVPDICCTGMPVGAWISIHCQLWVYQYQPHGKTNAHLLKVSEMLPVYPQTTTHLESVELACLSELEFLFTVSDGTGGTAEHSDSRPSGSC